MLDQLFKLSTFCEANRIEYAITGTLALHLLGVPSDFKPMDIDIKVFHLTPEQQAKLEELQFLSGLETEYKTGTCYSFLLDHVKVNAIVDNTKSYDIICGQCVDVKFVDEARKKVHFISVQLAHYALETKMRLNRNKDKDYLINLIQKLTNMVL